MSNSPSEAGSRTLHDKGNSPKDHVRLSDKSFEELYHEFKRIRETFPEADATTRQHGVLSCLCALSDLLNTGFTKLYFGFPDEDGKVLNWKLLVAKQQAFELLRGEYREYFAGRDKSNTNERTMSGPGNDAYLYLLSGNNAPKGFDSLFDKMEVLIQTLKKAVGITMLSSDSVDTAIEKFSNLTTEEQYSPTSPRSDA